MLFESRRVLQGIRTKICFDASLKVDDSYIFINVSEIPTIRHLMDDVKLRFGIHDNIKVLLEDCALLETENILVLVDIKEIRITPVPKQILLNHPSLNLIQDKSVDETDQPRELSDAEKENSLLTKKRRLNIDSIFSETAVFPVLAVNEIGETRSNCNTDKDNLQNAECNKFDADGNEESGDEGFVEKKRRKRKRKHSKKAKGECEDVNKFQNTGDFKRSVEVPSVQNHGSNPRQHIYFDDESHELESENRNLRRESPSPKGISPERKSSPCSYTRDVENEDENIDVESIEQTCTVIENSEFTFIKESRKDLSKSTDQHQHQHQYYDFHKPDYQNELIPIDMSTSVSANESFFNRYEFKRYDPLHLAPTKDEKQFWIETLLMRKELRVPERYYIQYNNYSNFKCPCINPTTVDENQFMQAEAEQVPVVANQHDYDENDCEMLIQRKVTGDTIFVRKGCEEWRILTVEEAIDRLEPPTQFTENQCLTFQFMYLSRDMSPKMSNLFCATVISFIEENETLRLIISPPFIEGLLKDCGEDSALPDDITWIEGNAYEIPLHSLRNIRLLM